MNFKLFSKCAQFDVARKSIFWMMAIVVIVVALAFFASIISNYRGSLISIPPKLNVELLSLRFLGNPDCFAYRDANGRVYPGVIDLAKFTPERMDACYKINTDKGYQQINFKLGLQNANKTVASNKYYNIEQITLIKKVQVRSGENVTEDHLMIYAQVDV